MQPWDGRQERRLAIEVLAALRAELAREPAEVVAADFAGQVAIDGVRFHGCAASHPSYPRRVLHSEGGGFKMSTQLSQLRILRPTQSGVATYPPGATFGPRKMLDYEFVWINEGDCEYRWNQTTVACPAGAVVLCKPGLDHFRWDPDSARGTRSSTSTSSPIRRPGRGPTSGRWCACRRRATCSGRSSATC